MRRAPLRALRRSTCATGTACVGPRLCAHIVRFAENHARDVDREYARLRAPIQDRIDGARSACLVD